MLLNKKVLVMGLGENGGGLFSAKFCLAHGAEVLVSDLQPEEKLRQSVAELRDFVAGSSSSAQLHFRLGCHELEDFQRADLVIKNPGVPKDSPYLKAAKAWTSDLALFLKLYPEVPILAITGTKGKSSIAHALHSVLQQFLPETMLAGNIGRSPLFYALQAIGLGDSRSMRERTAKAALSAPMVLELSSWQLGDLRELEQSRIVFRPQMACISNIMRDHQNRYAKFSDYVEDKFYIFCNLGKALCHQGSELPGELLLGTADAMFSGQAFWNDFAVRSLSQDLHHFELHYFAEGDLRAGRGIYWCGNSCFIREEKDTFFLDSAEFRGLGQHSFKNYCIASYMAYRFLKRSERTDLSTFCQKNSRHLLQYQGVPFRMERRSSVSLVSHMSFGANRTLHFINDTAATMPDATVLALEACLQRPEYRCLLIAGGTDKELDPSPLIEALRAKSEQVELFLLAGNGTDALAARLSRSKIPFRQEIFGSLQAAFSAATRYAMSLKQPEIYLLLSPGYASFGMFQNEFDRGRQFNQLVEEFCNQASTP